MLKSLFWTRGVNSKHKHDSFIKALKCQTAQFHSNISIKQKLSNRSKKQLRLPSQESNKNRVNINLSKLSNEALKNRTKISKSRHISDLEKRFLKDNYNCLSKFELKWIDRSKKPKTNDGDLIRRSGSMNASNFLPANTSLRTTSNFYPKSIPREGFNRRSINIEGKCWVSFLLSWK